MDYTLALVLAVGLSVLAIGVWSAAQLVRRRKAASTRPASMIDKESPSGMRAAAPLPPLRVPDELYDLCRQGDVILFVGAGFAKRAGLPTQHELLRLVLDQLLEQQEQSTEQAWRELHAQLTRVDASNVAEAMESRLGSQRFQHLLHSALREVSDRKVPDLYSRLAGVPFSGVITTNLDQSLERVFSRRRPLVISGTTDDDLHDIGVLRGERFFLLKLFGGIREPSSIVFGLRQLLMHSTDEELPRLMSSLFARRTVLFLGFSAADIEEIFFSFRIRSTQVRRHFAVIPAERDGELLRERMGSRFGITMLEYDPQRNELELERFVRAMPVEHGRSASARPALRVELLDEVVLRNIGPFAELSLPLTGSWNVLLGNNGCGKSTILRAIALAMAGDDRRVEPWASSLLRAGTSSGSVELRVGRNTYRTGLVRDGNRVLVKSEQITPVQAAAWLVLGFPSLRGVSSGNPAGPAVNDSPEPVVDDLLPLIDPAGLDHRMDRLKQWMVNTTVSSELNRVRGGGTESAGGQRDTFFAIIGRLMPGSSFAYAGIDQRTWDVLVRTDDGVVPIDRLSQGMSSAINWVGTVVQRLYEVYGVDENPHHRPALVLIDEIDAHLHPEWQARIVPILREVLPGLQVVASTHSPLVVGNLQPSELNHLRRHSGSGVTVERIEQSFRGWRADQILTGPAFDLDSSRDPATGELMREYRELLTHPDPSRTQGVRIREIAAHLEGVVPSHQETQTARRAEELVEEWMVGRLGDLSSDEQERVMQEARLYLGRLREGRP